MRTLKVIKTIIFLLGILPISSCKKDTVKPVNHNHSENVTATIDIANPQLEATFGLNDTININVKITGSGELHGYEILLKNTSQNDSVVFSTNGHLHQTTYQISESWINNVTQHSDMKLEVKAFITHDGNTETKTVSFHCHPM